MGFGESFMPVHLDNEKVTKAFLLLFPEVKSFYGSDVELELQVSLLGLD